MNRQEIIALIRRNKNTKREAIVLIADFLVKTRKEAEKIYEEEFGSD